MAIKFKKNVKLNIMENDNKLFFSFYYIIRIINTFVKFR